MERSINQVVIMNCRRLCLCSGNWFGILPSAAFSLWTLWGSPACTGGQGVALRSLPLQPSTLAAEAGPSRDGGPLPPRLLRADLKPSPGLPGAPGTLSCFSKWQVFSCLPQVSCKLEFLGALKVLMFTCGHFAFEPDLIFDEIIFLKKKSVLLW